MKRAVGLICLMALAFACREDDDSGPGYDFKDRDVQGEIDGEEWAYQDGYADINDGNIHITLILEQEGEEGCAVFLADGDQVFFTVPAEEGLYKLSFESGDGRTVTLFEDEDAINYIAADGAVEILDVTGSQVKGRIDARESDEPNYVNGNFTVPICD